MEEGNTLGTHALSLTPGACHLIRDDISQTYLRRG